MHSYGTLTDITEQRTDEPKGLLAKHPQQHAPWHWQCCTCRELASTENPFLSCSITCRAFALLQPQARPSTWVLQSFPSQGSITMTLCSKGCFRPLVSPALLFKGSLAGEQPSCKGACDIAGSPAAPCPPSLADAVPGGHAPSAAAAAAAAASAAAFRARLVAHPPSLTPPLRLRFTFPCIVKASKSAGECWECSNLQMHRKDMLQQQHAAPIKIPSTSCYILTRKRH